MRLIKQEHERDLQDKEEVLLGQLLNEKKSMAQLQAQKLEESKREHSKEKERLLKEVKEYKEKMLKEH